MRFQNPFNILIPSYSSDYYSYLNLGSFLMTFSSLFRYIYITLNPDNYPGLQYAQANNSSEKYTSAKSITNEITGLAGVYFVRVSAANEGSNFLRIIKQ